MNEGIEEFLEEVIRICPYCNSMTYRITYTGCSKGIFSRCTCTRCGTQGLMSLQKSGFPSCEIAEQIPLSLNKAVYEDFS